MSDRASTKHREAWESLISAAEENEYAHYAIYASRTLAVRHPDIYLRGDRWFYEGASRLAGFAECYEDPTALGWCHMEYGRPFFEGGADYAGIPGGEPLAFDSIELREYRLATPDRICVGPYEPLLDHRFGPMAVSLKTEGRVVTPLELAEIAYFSAIARGADSGRLFLVLAGDGSAYLLEGDRLLSMVTLTECERPTADACLVFNEYAAWHPLMGRDDSDLKLQRAIGRLGGIMSLPGEHWVDDMIAKLQRASELTSDRQKGMAALAATRATGWRCHPYFDEWREFVPEDDFDISISRRLCIIRDFDRRANAVSPAAAHLYAITGEDGSMDERMRRLSREYLVRTAVVREAKARGWKQAWRLESWGHVWPCGLMEHTIDDAFRSRTGHCVSQCHMMGAVLSLLDVPHVIVNFDRGGVKEGISHHFVLSRDGSFLFDDGIVNLRGVDAETEDYGPLLSFSVNGEWARTVSSGIYGNVSSERLRVLLGVVSGAVADRFPLEFFADRKTREIASMDGFVQEVRDKGVEGVSLP